MGASRARRRGGGVIDLPEVLRLDAGTLALSALETQGVRAFDNPLSAAAFHEAGHAVVYASHGHSVEQVKVWRKKRGSARGQWVGFTTVHAGMLTGPDTPVEKDFAFAMILIAGVLAEQLFDTANFRMASSIDEIAIVRGIANNITIKNGEAFEAVMTKILVATALRLKHHEPEVRAIAAELRRSKIIGRKRLATFLAPARGEGGSNGLG